MIINYKEFSQFRSERNGYFTDFSHNNIIEAIDSLIELGATLPELGTRHHKELGLAAYGRPPKIYLVNGDYNKVSLDDIINFIGDPEMDLHTHGIGIESIFPSVDDYKYNHNGNYFILSNSSGTHYITKYAIRDSNGNRTVFNNTDSGTCIWPGNEQGKPISFEDDAVRYNFYLGAIHDAGLMRVFKSDGCIAADVLALELLKELHITYGDDMFYKEVEWYEEGKRLIDKNK